MTNRSEDTLHPARDIVRVQDSEHPRVHGSKLDVAPCPQVLPDDDDDTADALDPRSQLQSGFDIAGIVDLVPDRTGGGIGDRSTISDDGGGTRTTQADRRSDGR